MSDIRCTDIFSLKNGMKIVGKNDEVEVLVDS